MLRRTGFILTLVAALLAAACVRPRDSYPPPMQRSQNIEPWAVDRPFFQVGDVDASEYIVRDVDLTNCGKGWCWTLAQPQLRFILNSVERQKFVADFGVMEATFAQTGPLTVSFRINGQLLGEVYCPKPASMHFEKAVPASWLSTKRDTRVTMLTDKLFVSKLDGVALGFTLMRAGFVE
jgi:hypothetical protein